MITTQIFHKLTTYLCFGTVFEKHLIVVSLSDVVKLNLTENISNKPGKRLIWGSKNLRSSRKWRPFCLVKYYQKKLMLLRNGLTIYHSVVAIFALKNYGANLSIFYNEKGI